MEATDRLDITPARSGSRTVVQRAMDMGGGVGIVHKVHSRPIVDEWSVVEDATCKLGHSGAEAVRGTKAAR
jgi:hypothetical protein